MYNIRKHIQQATYHPCQGVHMSNLTTEVFSEDIHAVQFTTALYLEHWFTNVLEAFQEKDIGIRQYEDRVTFTLNTCDDRLELQRYLIEHETPFEFYITYDTDLYLEVLFRFINGQYCYAVFDESHNDITAQAFIEAYQNQTTTQLYHKLNRKQVESSPHAFWEDEEHCKSKMLDGLTGLPTTETVQQWKKKVISHAGLS